MFTKAKERLANLKEERKRQQEERERLERERIQAEKDALMQLSEKELMVHAVMLLRACNKKLNDLERRVASIESDTSWIKMSVD